MVWRNVGQGDAGRRSRWATGWRSAWSRRRANPDAIGSWIEIRTGDRTAVREVTVGGGHAGGELGWIHVGLGGNERADVRVQWPDGETGPWMTVDADQFVILERGADARSNLERRGDRLRRVDCARRGQGQAGSAALIGSDGARSRRARIENGTTAALIRPAIT